MMINELKIDLQQDYYNYITGKKNTCLEQSKNIDYNKFYVCFYSNMWKRIKIEIDNAFSEKQFEYLKDRLKIWRSI